MKRIRSIAKVLAVSVLVLGLAGMLAACAPKETAEGAAEGQAQAAAQKSLIDTIVERGVMKVGVSTFTPWAFKDKDGNLIGFEIDVINKVAKDIGVEVEFVPTQWSGIIPALLTGKFDAIICGMTITPQRALQVSFTNPYDYAGQSIAASKALTGGGKWKSIEDFNKPNVVLAARMGSTAAETIKKVFPKAELRQFDDEAGTVQEVLNGKAYGVVSSAPKPLHWVTENPDTLYLPVGSKTLNKEPIGMALRRGDIETLTFFNNWIETAWDSGFLQGKHDYWFGTLDWTKFIEQ